MENKKEINVDVTKIMEEIRADIEQRGLRDEVLSFEDIPMPESVAVLSNDLGPFNSDALADANDYMNRCFQVQVWHPIQGTGVLGFLVVFIKRVIRKLIRFFIDPIVSDQNDFNMMTAKSANQVRNYINDNDKKVAEMEEELQSVNSLLEKNLDLMDTVEALTKRIAQLEEKISSLEKK